MENRTIYAFKKLSNKQKASNNWYKDLNPLGSKPVTIMVRLKFVMDSFDVELVYINIPLQKAIKF